MSDENPAPPKPHQFKPVTVPVNNMLTIVRKIGKIRYLQGDIKRKLVRRVLIEDLTNGSNNRANLVLYDNDAIYFPMLLDVGGIYGWEVLESVRNLYSAECEVLASFSVILIRFILKFVQRLCFTS